MRRRATSRGSPRALRSSRSWSSWPCSRWSAMPQSHELRYYMDWMIVLVLLNLWLACRSGSRARPRVFGVVAAAAMGVVIAVTHGDYVRPVGSTLRELAGREGRRQGARHGEGRRAHLHPQGAVEPPLGPRAPPAATLHRRRGRGTRRLRRREARPVTALRRSARASAMAGCARELRDPLVLLLT